VGRAAGDSVIRRKDGQVWIGLTKQLRWPPPTSSPRGSAPAYVITLDFAYVGGRVECVRVAIGGDLEDPGSPDPSPVTASVLRGIPLRRLVDEALVEHTRTLRRWARERWPRGQRPALLAERVAAAEASLGRPPGRPPMYTEDHFKEVAATYDSAYAARDHPTEAVADEWDVSIPTAAKWVARARQLGFLRPTKRGLAKGVGPAGEPTSIKPSPTQPRKSRRVREIERIEAQEDFEAEVLRRHEELLEKLFQLPLRPSPQAAPTTTRRRSEQARGAPRRVRPKSWAEESAQSPRHDSR
jgi:hypothetical protein